MSEARLSRQAGLGGKRRQLTRRDLIAGLAAGAFAGTRSCLALQRTATQQLAGSLSDPVYFSSATTLASAIRAKEISSQEIVRTCLERIESTNSKLNSVVQVARDSALLRARQADAALARGENWGPLHGVPMTIKDSFDTAGIISTGGTKGRESFVPAQDATVVARLKAAGAVLLGKTNTPELTLSYETDNLVYGRTSNPYDLARSSGGSSGGAAAIVAAGGSPFDLGSDYGGSIRIPCHYCGIAGIKPTSGRVPRTGNIYSFGGVQDGFQQIGPMARTVDDLTLILPLIMGPDNIDPAILEMDWNPPDQVAVDTLRIAFFSENGIGSPTPETAQAVESAAKTLESKGARVTESRPPGIENTLRVGLPLYFWDGGAAVRRMLGAAGTIESPMLGGSNPPALTAVQLDAAVTRWYAWRSGMHAFLDQQDVLICPVAAGPALAHGSAYSARVYPFFSYSLVCNLTGWPVVIVRAGTSPEGLPIGVQVITGPGREGRALAVAKVIETALGGFRPPEI